MQQTQKSTLQKEQTSNVDNRRKSYLKYLDRYPIYSTLIVLKEYEDRELYEECGIIKKALIDFKEQYRDSIPKDIKFPMHLSEYQSRENQEFMLANKIKVDDKNAKETAKLIMLNIPIKR